MAYITYPNHPRTLYLSAYDPAVGRYAGAYRETCTVCGAQHDAVWTVRRVIADTLGPWNVYRIAGEAWTLPGGGIPLPLARLPRDAARLSPADASAYWHRED